MKINLDIKNNQRLINEIKSLIRHGNGFAVLSLRDLQHLFRSNNLTTRFLDMKNQQFINLLKLIAKNCNFKYIIYIRKNVAGERWGKFYFFNNLNHDLAQALLVRKQVKIIEV